MEKILKQIGLCYTAKKTVLGIDNIVTSMRTKKIGLVIMSGSCSFNTQKLVQDKAKTYNTRVIIIDEFDGNTISNAIGKENVKVIGVKDKGFKRMIIHSIKGE